MNQQPIVIPVMKHVIQHIIHNINSSIKFGHMFLDVKWPRTKLIVSYTHVRMCDANIYIQCS